MKTEINNINSNWKNVKNKCRTTVNKKYTDNEPTTQFKRKLLISEHSPIRLIIVDWTWTAIKSWIATHWSRHCWQCFISTQRSDRTGIDRNKLQQDAPVNFDGVANAQNLIDTMRKRLCYCADPETRKLAEDLKETIRDYEPELSSVLVPNCVYRCGCPEFSTCGFWDKLKSRCGISDNIENRYEAYNNFFYSQRSNRKE